MKSVSGQFKVQNLILYQIIGRSSQRSMQNFELIITQLHDWIRVFAFLDFSAVELEKFCFSRKSLLSIENKVTLCWNRFYFIDSEKRNETLADNSWTSRRTFSIGWREHGDDGRHQSWRKTARLELVETCDFSFQRTIEECAGRKYEINSLEEILNEVRTFRRKLKEKTKHFFSSFRSKIFTEEERRIFLSNVLSKICSLALNVDRICGRVKKSPWKEIFSSFSFFL